MKKILTYICNCIYPQFCIICNTNETVQNYICKKCREKILSKYVGNTRKKANTYDNIIYVTGYTEFKKYILGHKFKYQKYMYLLFSTLLVDRLKENNITFDYIISVPISKNRYKERGYNQVELIADYIERGYCGKHANILYKKVDNKRQSEVSKKARASNVKDIFARSEERRVGKEC